jgi:hypothetical protein
VLLVTGFVGGIFSALCGSGVDICSFSILSLLFRCPIPDDKFPGK